MNALTIACVALGGFVGAPTRFLADRAISRRLKTDLPVGTFLINISGSLLLGVITGLLLTGHVSMSVKALVGTGFCGAYTTFSTWSFETVRLFEEHEPVKAFANAFVSLVIGLLAAGAGLALGLLHW